MKRKAWGCVLCAFVCFLSIAADVFAEEITIALTGQTHALLTPCHCPIEPDGGIARRATLLSQLRKKKRNVLVIDSGSFFAGGQMDQNSLGLELDKARTLVHLKAMDAMQYDAVAINEDELNFGRKFLEEAVASTRTAFLSANVPFSGVKPYLVKKFGQNVIGVAAISPVSVAPKTEGVEYIDPQQAARTVVGELKKRGAGIIVLVSGLTEGENQKLLNEFPQISVLIDGATFAKEQLSRRIGATAVVAPRWEGRRLVTITVNARNNRALDTVVEDIRLSDKLTADRAMLALLPACFSAKDCSKEGMVSACVNPGTAGAACSFTEAPRVDLTVITKDNCRTCSTKGPLEFLKRQIPGLNVTTLNFPSKQADALIAELGIRNLPVYLFAKDLEKEKTFDGLKKNLEPRGQYYMLKPQSAGIGYFLHRHTVKGRVDVFLSLFRPDTTQILDNLKEFNPEIHFLLIEQDGKFFSPAGDNPLEIEESLRAVCVQEHYPGIFYNYVRCRAANPGTAWWEDCLPETLDAAVIRQCARSRQGQELLRENIALGRELEIAAGPTYLLDNEEIFGSSMAPTKEEFRKIILEK